VLKMSALNQTIKTTPKSIKTDLSTVPINHPAHTTTDHNKNADADITSTDKDTAHYPKNKVVPHGLAIILPEQNCSTTNAILYIETTNNVMFMETEQLLSKRTQMSNLY